MGKQYEIDEYQIYYSSSHVLRRYIELRQNGGFVARLVFVPCGVPLPQDTDSPGERIKMYFYESDFEPVLKVLTSGPVFCYFNGSGMENLIRTEPIKIR